MERVGNKIDISKFSKELGVAKDTLDSNRIFSDHGCRNAYSVIHVVE
jgi:hypothetical protein